MRLVLAALALALACAGCHAPRYALYTSPNRDFQCQVPWAWNVMFDSEGTHFTNVTFIGPFEPEFYLGAPSYSVRWYTRYATHRLRDGSLEMYSGPDDFIRQTLDAVYGADRQMYREVQDVKLKSGLTFKYFVVVSPGPAQAGAQWGIAVDKDGKSINPRKHAYAILPMPSGFYVLTFPATRQAYDAKKEENLERLKIYRDQFDALAGSFTPLKDGPGGAPLSPSTQSRTR